MAEEAKINSCKEVLSGVAPPRCYPVSHTIEPDHSYSISVCFPHDTERHALPAPA